MNSIRSIYDAFPCEKYEDTEEDNYNTGTPIRFVECDVCGKSINVSFFENHKKSHNTHIPEIHKEEKIAFPKESNLLKNDSFTKCSYEARKDYVVNKLIGKFP